MKILIIIDDYLPDSIKVGAKMVHELAVEMVTRSHTVDVLTPDPGLKSRREKFELDGVTIYKFYSGEIKNISKIKRAINESLLSFRALYAYRNYFKNSTYDLIIYYSPSIFFGPLVGRLKKKWNSKSYLILRDFFPTWAVDSGLLKEKSLITKYFRYFEKINYSAADYIGIQSPKNLQLFKDENGERYKYLHVLYNWAEDKKVLSDNIYRKKWGLENKIIFFYGGNIGHAQDMLNIVRLAQNMKDYKEVFFIILGQGDEYNLVEQSIASNNILNMKLLPSVNQEEFKKILAEIDVGLFSLHPDHSTQNFPGKLLGYMVQEIPILGSINSGNDLKEVIEEAQAGYISINGEDDILYELACKLIDSKTRKRMGENGKKLLLKTFSVSSAADIIFKNNF